MDKGKSAEDPFESNNNTDGSNRTEIENIYEPIYTCEICKYTSLCHINYHKHLVSTHTKQSETNIICWYCEEKLSWDETKKQITLKKRVKKLKEHLNDKAEIMSLDFRCYFCSYVFANKVELDTHINCIHHNEIAVKPENRTEDEKESDMMEVVSTVAFVCDICNWKSARHFNYHRHVLSHTLGKSFHCSYCKKVIKPINSKTGYGQVSHSCKLCKQIFHSKLKYDTHMFEIHNEKGKGSRACHMCGFTAWSIKTIERHHMLEHSLDPFSEKNTVQNRSKKDLAQYTCEECGFTCNRVDTMNKHRLTHVPESKRELFSCDMCEYKTYVKASLNMHLSKKHNKSREDMIQENIYVCDVCLKYLSKTKEDLKKHKDTCTENVDLDEDPRKDIIDAVMTPSLSECDTVKGVSEISCSVESKKDKKQSKKSKFLCDQCDMVFNRRWNLVRHKDTAHNRKKTQCEHCEYRTCNWKALHNHYTGIHMISPPEDLEHLKKANEEKEDKYKMELRALTINKCGLTSNNKKLDCQFCGQSLLASNLPTHIKTRHFSGKKNFHCHHKECDFQTNTAYNLKSHVMHIHNSNHLILGSKPQVIIDKDECIKVCANCLFQTRSVAEMLDHHHSGKCPGVAVQTHKLPASINDHVNIVNEPNQKDLLWAQSFIADGFKKRNLSTANTEDTGNWLINPVTREVSEYSLPNVTLNSTIQIKVNSVENNCLDNASIVNTILLDASHREIVTNLNSSNLIPPSFTPLATSLSQVESHLENNPALQEQMELSEGGNIAMVDPPSYREAVDRNIYTPLQLHDCNNIEFKEVLKDDEVCFDRLTTSKIINDETVEKLDNENFIVHNVISEISQDSQNNTGLEKTSFIGNEKICHTFIDTDHNGEYINMRHRWNQHSDESIIENRLFPVQLNSRIKPEEVIGEKSNISKDKLPLTNDNTAGNSENGSNCGNMEKLISQTSLPKFIIEKKDDNTTVIIVQNKDDTQVSYEIHGHLNVSANGELPADLYNFISEMLDRQQTSDFTVNDAEQVVYCDIVVNDA